MSTRPGDSTKDLFRLVNMDRYPIRERSAEPARKAIELLRQTFVKDGVVELAEFIVSEAVSTLLEDALVHLPEARESSGYGSIYVNEGDDSLWPEGHPRRLAVPERLRLLSYDQFPSESILRRLFEWDHILHLICDITGDSLYRYADPLGGLNVTVTASGEEKGWHFDQADYGAAIALQPAENGGEFEVIPFVRTAEHENYEEVIRCLEGDRSRVRQFAMHPGNLVLFQGRYSLHRVAPVQGTKPRLVAILAYDRKPDTKGSEFLNKSRYGAPALGS